MKIKVIYISPYDILRARTNQISDLRFAAGFNDNGIDLIYICPYIYRKNNIKKKNIFSSYNIKNEFKILFLPLPIVELEKITKYLYTPLFIFCSVIFISTIYIINYLKGYRTIVFSRSIHALNGMMTIKKFINIKKLILIYWAHECLNNKKYKFVYNNINILCATNYKITKDILLLSKKNIPYVITYNPISSSQLNFNISKETLRKKLNLPLESTIVGYTGKLYKKQQEVEYILQAAMKLEYLTFLFTGGKDEVIKYYNDYCKKRKIKNVIFTGFLIKYSSVIEYQKASDILISYYTKQDHLTEYNLPQKIPEYMTTMNPIVTPDYDATREILTNANTVFVEPENVESLITGLKRVSKDKEFAKNIASQAYDDIKHITFLSITKEILNKVVLLSK